MNHLGGHQWITHIDEGLLKLLQFCGYKTLIDVGCGPAGNVKLARELGMEAIGIDGDPELLRLNAPNMPLIAPHDYTKGRLPPQMSWDDGDHDRWDLNLTRFEVGLSTEFLEHVEEKYIPNIMDTFQRCKIVICTHGLPGETWGHHHVNLQTEEYWVEMFSKYGFTYSKAGTDKIRAASTMRKGFIKRTGKMFINGKH
jgi:hypothetical protein